LTVHCPQTFGKGARYIQSSLGLRNSLGLSQSCILCSLLITITTCGIPFDKCFGAVLHHPPSEQSVKPAHSGPQAATIGSVPATVGRR
ncbi:hypothetical protein BaRGS_00037571, partial [Batillaria attramentaria]